MQRIILPHQMKLRAYQKPIWNSVFKKNMNLWLCQHRRAGKTKLMVSIICGRSFTKRRSLLLLLPTISQARDVIWKGEGSDGIPFLDHFPKSIVKHVDNKYMEVNFLNGSRLKVSGSDKTDHRGNNYDTIIYDEFAFQDPAGREAIRPMITENGGVEYIISTPFGHNHFEDAYEEAVKNPESWYTSLLTVEDTYRNPEEIGWKGKGFGGRVVPQEAIDELRRTNYPEAAIQREFYCSFNEDLEGIILNEEIKKMESENRIRDFPIDPHYPISTYWDLGVRDLTAIWVVQHTPDWDYVIGYYHNNFQPLIHFKNWVDEFRRTHGNLMLAEHNGPHDVEKREQSTAVSTKKLAENIGLYFRVVKRPESQSVKIEMGKSCMHRMIIHKTNCANGIKSIKHWHKEWDEKRGCYKPEPVHDGASHGADAFCLIGQAREQFKVQLSFVHNKNNFLEKYGL